MQKNNVRPRKMLKKKQEYIEVNMAKDKNKYSIYYAGIRNSQEMDTYKSINNRKSLEINNTQPVRTLNTITQLSRPVYRRISYHQKINGPQSKRYEEQDHQQLHHQTQLKNRASPYLKKQRQQHQQTTLGRTSMLNRSIQSNIKVRSGHLTKQLSPYQLYKQPRSSLSQHYDPTLQTSLHKRRQSYIQDKNESLKIAKQYYKNSNFDKCCQFLTKYLRSYSLSNEAVVQAHYLLGMSLINKGEHKNGVQALQKVLDINPQYKKTVYLIMALAYKKLSLYKDAIDVISKGLQLFPDYYDLLIYRGKMYLKEEKFQLSRNDFISAILLNKNKGFAYLGKGTCEINMKLIDQAIKTFTLGLQTDLAHICYEKRGICYYEQQYYQKSLSDLEQASTYDSYLSSALHYYKGMIYYKRKNFTEALLSFQQCLKQDNNKQLVTLAIEMMLKIKIQDKDFYEAYHLINRTENVQCDKNVIQQWRLFLEGSLFLMKKKYKDGLEAYDQLQRKELYQKNFEAIQLESQRQRFKFIKPLIHLYKAFGYLSQNLPQKALLEYQYHSAICKSISESQENLSKKYNTLIVLASKSFPNNTTTLLQSAKHLIPTKPQPYLFIAFDLLHSLRQKKFLTLNHVTEGSYQKQRTLEDIVENLSIGISHLPQLSNNHISSFYYFRAIIELYRQEFNKAVADIDKAIQKSEDNIPKYFYLRGLIFACFGNFSQAVQDFSVAINLDEKYAKPYLQRAKCLQIQGSSNQAFIDLQKYITLAPQDPYIHKYAGFLLFQNCAYEDCLSAFSHGSQLPNDGELILTKAKCNFLLGHYSEALEYFDNFRTITSSKEFDNDTKLIKICNQIASLSSSSPNENFSSVLSKLKQIGSLFSQDNSKIFKQRDVHQIRGSIYLIKGDYDMALEEFNQTLENFRIEKQKEFEKNLVQDPNEFEEQWSEIQIKFNMSLCYLCKKEYDLAYELTSEFSESTEKGKNWDVFFALIEQLLMERYDLRQINLDTFEQNIRISKLWPKISLPGTNIVLSMAFSYPFVQPPQMMPQFDLTLFEQFTMLKVEPKPQAPWINRNNSGLVFTPNIQNYDNLELSMTTKKNDDESQADDHNKPTSEIQQSISLSNSQFHLPTEDLKKKFKLDSMVQMKLNKILNK